MKTENILNLVEVISTSKRLKEGTVKYIFVSNETHKNQLKSKVIESTMITSTNINNLCVNDIVICKLQGLDKVYLIDEGSKNYVFSNDFIVFRCNDTKYVMYLYYYFLSNKFKEQKEQLCSGISKKRLQVGSLKNLNIDIYENLFDNIEELNELYFYHKELIKKESNLLKTNLQKKGMLYNKLTEKVNLEESSMRICKLKEVIDNISIGSKKNLKYCNNGIKYLSSKNLTNNQLDYENVKFISDIDDKYLRYTCSPKKNDLLINSMTSECAIVECEEVFNIDNTLLLFQPNNNVILTKYLFLVLKSKYFKGIVRNMFKPLDINDLSKIDIPIYSLEEQCKLIEEIEYNEKLINDEIFNIKMVYNTRNNELLERINSLCISA